MAVHSVQKVACRCVSRATPNFACRGRGAEHSFMLQLR
jgi:hypothetical protein